MSGGCNCLFIGGPRSGEIRWMDCDVMAEIPRRFAEYLLGRVVSLPVGCGMVAIYAAADPIPAVRHAHFATASTLSHLVTETMDVHVAWAKYMRETDLPFVEPCDLEQAGSQCFDVVERLHWSSKRQARIRAKAGT